MVKKLSIFILILLFQYGTPSEAGAVLNVKIGIYNNAPLIFADEKGMGKGFFADIIDHVAAREKWNIEYVPGTWQQGLSRLGKGEIDILCNIAYSKERDKLYDFTTENLLTNWGQLYTSASSDIKTVTDLAGKKVAVLGKDIHYAVFRKIIQEFGIKCQITEANDYHAVLDLVSNKKADAGVVNRFFGMKYAGTYNVDKSGVIFNPIKIHFAVPEGKNKSLISLIDRHIRQLKRNENSVYYHALSKWLGETSHRQVFPLWARWTLITALGIALLFFLGNMFLRTKIKAKTKKLVAELGRRKQAESALKLSEERYRGIIEDTPILICRYSPGGIIDYVNEAYCRYFGKTRKALMGQNFLASIPEKDRKAVEDDLSALTPDNPVQTHEHPVVSSDGKIGWQRWTQRALFDDQGEPVAFQAIGEDISELKKKTLALEESEEKLRRITQSAQDAIIMMDDQGRVSFWNESASRIFGYSHKEILGKDLHALLTSEPHQAKYMKAFPNFVKTGKGFFIDKTAELSGIKKNGAVFPLELSLSAVTIRGKRHAIAIIRDITERMLSHEAEKKMEKKLQQAQKMEAIGTLSGGIAHDFNNILSAVIGYTELSLGDVEKGTILEKNLQGIYTAGNRAKDLVKQILTFARQADEHIMPVQVDTIVKEVLKLIRSSIPTTIEVRQDIQNRIVIMSTPTQVHQVFMNLCTNAAHVMEEDGGILDVKLKKIVIEDSQTLSRLGLKAGAYLKATVSDTGPGIRSDIRDAIFDPYFTTKKVGKGTGMGLAMVHGIVESCGGRITVDSKLGKGTVFTLFLPVSERHVMDPAFEPKGLPTGTERILFIDDELPIATMSSQMLERLGYRVTTRTDSMDALALFQSKPEDFDLVITDMTMPNLTGDILAAQLMKIRSDIPIILCTGYSKKISDETAVNMGVKALAYKPVIMSDLAKTVRNILDAPET